MSAETNLDLEEIGVSPGSGRGLTQSLAPATSGTLVTLADGEVVDRGRPAFRKYRTSINFADVIPFALGDLWEGDIVTIHSVAEIEQAASKARERRHVPGSIVWRDAQGFELPSGADETVMPADAAWQNYRPILHCRVEGWELETDEYGVLHSGSVSFVERFAGGAYPEGDG
jgi:hypothetical protein